MKKIKGKDDNYSETKYSMKRKINPFNILIQVVLLFTTFIYMIITIKSKNTTLLSLIGPLLLFIFSVLFTMNNFLRHRNIFITIFSALILSAYFALNINNNLNVLEIPTNKMIDFQGKSLTYALKWASNHNIHINQEYEYSDMLDEYKIISQNIKSGTSLKGVKEITVSISEGPNPYKELVIPNMISWDSTRVLNFVKDNYLANVDIDFVDSDKQEDTVIEQSFIGNMKRDEPLKLVFSHGEEKNIEEVKLMDFTDMSEFEVMFYMKKNQITYEFDKDFSNTIKIGNAIRQNIAPGTTINVKNEKIIVTISKGTKIEIPNLLEYNLTELSEWAINNRLKISFTDKYDDTIPENNVISANYSKGDIVEQGTLIKLVLSRGNIKMPSFKSIDDFYKWANKYNINYQEEYEFSDSVPAGEVIKYSYDTGTTIKNNDVIIVTISNGAKKTVPNVKGLTRTAAIKKLNNSDVKYSIVYRNSDTVSKDYVINQSIASGSEISPNTTVIITISSGKSENNTQPVNDNNNNNQPTENPTPTPAPDPTPTPEPTPTCNSCRIPPSLITSTLQNNTGKSCSTVANILKSAIENEANAKGCAGLKVSVRCEKKDGHNSLDFISGFSGGNTDSCQTVSITIAE